jgi:hypothetical protein
MDLKDGQMYKYETKSNTFFPIPAKNYRLISYTAIAKDKNGIEWSAKCYFNNRQIKIKPNETVHLEAGAPFVTSIKVTKVGSDQAKMALMVIGKGGDNYTIQRLDGKSRLSRFKVMDKSGKLLWQGSFKYG